MTNIATCPANSWRGWSRPAGHWPTSRRCGAARHFRPASITGRYKMLQVAPPKSSNKQAFVLRRRFEFLGAILFAALVPWAGLRWLIADTTFDSAAYHNSLFANALAICMALWIRISVSTYPGIRSGQLILPAIVASHATMVTLLLLSRLPYHRPSLAAGFLLHLVWAYGIYFFVQPRVRPRIALVPVRVVAAVPR